MKEQGLLIQSEDVPTPAPLMPANTNPLAILSLAVERGAGIETIERLVALHQQMEEREAKAEFDLAMTEAQKEMAPVRTNADNPQTRSRYATYKAIDKMIELAFKRGPRTALASRQESRTA
jgi:hypothetical protein